MPSIDPTSTFDTTGTVDTFPTISAADDRSAVGKEHWLLHDKEGNASVATQNRLLAHEVDTTAVHGIADTTALVTSTALTAAVLAARTFAPVIADATGATDVSATFVTAASTVPDKYVPAGSYRFSTNSTLTGRWWFEKGAKLVLDANVVVVFTGVIVDSGDAQIFDVTTNAGARVQLDGFSAFARPEWWGCKGDWQHVTDAAITSGTAILTSATGRFAATDVGKNIGVTGAQADGSGHFNLTLTTTILSYQSPTQVTLTANASATVTGAEAQWWTNDQAPMQQCINGIAGAIHKHLRLSRTYVCHQSGSNAWSIDLSKRGVGDGVCTIGSPNISSATAHFTKADEGCYLAGGVVQIPGGTKILRVTSPTTAIMDQNALASSTTRTWIISISNLTISAVKGQGYIKHPTGMPNASVAVVRANGNANLTLLGVGIDGNWGNFVGNTQTGPPGVNHVFQTDPKNYGLQTRGLTNCVIDYCDFRQTYGDMIWIGSEADGAAWPAGEVNRDLDVRIDHCTGDMSGRDGIAIGAMCERITVHASTFTNVHTQGIDLEPQGQFQYARDIVIDNCKIGGWFDKTNLGENDAVSIEGGSQTVPSYLNLARGIRVTNCDLAAGILIFGARDVIIRNNRIVKDWLTNDAPCVRVQGYNDNVLIDGNYIYSNVLGASSPATVDIIDYVAGTTVLKPANVTVSNNTILSKNGRHGVKVRSTGQPSAYVAGTTYVPGMIVRDVNVTYECILGGTGNTPASSPTFWAVWDERTGDGSGGMVVIDGNLIDCLNDTNGAGLHGVLLDAGGHGPNMRVTVRNNRIRAATTHGVNVALTGINDAYLYLAIDGNFAWDDQNTPTCTNTVYLEAPVRVTTLRMSGNVAHTGVTAPIGGIAAGYWQTGGDIAPTFAGYGAPESVVTAPIGATYQRVDGTTNTAVYRKESGSGNTGWIAASQLPAGTEAHFTGVVATNQAVTNEIAVYTNPTDLNLLADVNEVWLVDYDIQCDGAAGADMKWKLDVPAGASFVGSVISFGTAVSANNPANAIQMFGGVVAATPVNSGTIAAGTIGLLRIRGVYTTVGTGGNLQFKFNQASANATPTTVYAGSRVEARRHSP